jgi:hypothetical protein
MAAWARAAEEGTTRGKTEGTAASLAPAGPAVAPAAEEFSVQWSGSGAFVAKNFYALRLVNLCVNSISSASFASTVVQ